MSMSSCKGFICTKCGKCCREMPIDIVASDIIRWYNDSRWDILTEVSYIDNYPDKGKGGFYIAKTTFAPKQSCPFLEDNKCSIHDTKPFVCKNAPYAHKEFKVCPVFDSNDISSEDRKMALTKEHMSFKSTYFNRSDLLQLLIEVRSKCQA